MQSLGAIANSKLYMFVGSGVQGLFRAATEVVHCVAEGRPPVFDKNVQGFLLQVKQRLPYFATLVTPCGARLTGLEALKKELGLAQEKGANQLTFEDLKVSSHFGWLLGDNEANTYQALRDQALKNHDTGLIKVGTAAVPGEQQKRRGESSKCRSKGSASSAKAQAKKKANSEVEAALAMFCTATK